MLSSVQAWTNWLVLSQKTKYVFFLHLLVWIYGLACSRVESTRTYPGYVYRLPLCCRETCYVCAVENQRCIKRRKHKLRTTQKCFKPCTSHSCASTPLRGLDVGNVPCRLPISCHFCRYNVLFEQKFVVYIHASICQHHGLQYP